jgi:hypothetical protein
MEGGKHMPTSTELVDWANKYAADLELDMEWTQQGAFRSGYWQAESPSDLPKIRARAIAALNFLEQFSGSDSQWAIRGRQVFDNNGENQSMESGARALGAVLRVWADAVSKGIVAPLQAEAQGVRAVASTDIMEQVRVLVEDKGVYPASPIMLAGAALEVALRSAVAELKLELKERPSIGAYARCLRQAKFISAQDMKDVDQMAGVRNSAAHGEFDELSRERAGLMEQQVNLFLTKLSSLLDSN